MISTANSKQIKKLLHSVRWAALGSMELGVTGFNDSSVSNYVRNKINQFFLSQFNIEFAQLRLQSVGWFINQRSLL